MRRSPDLYVCTSPAKLDRCSALELGAVVSLLLAAWEDTEEPCTLAGDDSSLAMVARVTDSQWAEIRLRVLGTLDAAAGASGRVELRLAKRVYMEGREAEASLSSKRSAAAAARWGRQPGQARRPDQAGRPAPPRCTCIPDRCTCNAIASKTDASASAKPALRSESSGFALPLSRSNQEQKSERSERPEKNDVIAQLGEGARALAQERVNAWRREKSLRMIQDAAARWRAEGLTNWPMQRCGELASCAAALPARVEAIVSNADGMIAAWKADQAAGRPGRKPNPIGLLIAGLGESERTQGRPIEIPLEPAARWDRLERETLKLAETQAAIHRRMADAKRAMTDQPQRAIGGGA
jgi:uncharacterized protein YdaU (DUF1376 family)